MNVYKSCPTFENDKYKLRLIKAEDAADLLKVYSDVKAVPFFNNDNCHGDNFYYTTAERMQQAIGFWIFSYQNGYFVRWSIIDKITNEVIGTIEEFLRTADDYFTDCGLLRFDLRSDYEKASEISSILSLIVPPSFDIFGCDKIATKSFSAATERTEALKNCGFAKTREKLIGADGTEYDRYFVFKKRVI